ncbi:8-amino-7-oxononanoate synthase [Vibrio sinensis]|uniref:8-amino-7-oxononanoate synthase n=1 Tax=Vibrio sinensis TaxID=2302434 RepID=A0A3A6QHS0_9VIBR|nr:8-amino-7-oxononanoate synthase [Vibrio sinensis]RJX70234.1 8-amino-7-oxononanoate synthase [Vibrio sinensis]
MPAFNRRIEEALNIRKDKGLTRKLIAVDQGNGIQLSHDGRQYINFSSNDYLGLATDPELSQAWQEGIARYGNGSGASPLVTGYSSAHDGLEKSLCEWLGYPRAILFGSGFSANQAILFSLLEKDDSLFQDRLNHASLMEAGMLSPATMRRFQHNDTAHLATLLQRENENLNSAALVVTEGVFSMDGDRAPLAEIAAMINSSAWLMVDDAHGFGVLGERGRGSCDESGIHPHILIVTFGKAMGMSGAAVLCSEEVGDYLTQFSRHHVYSTAMPPAQAYALTYALKMVQQQEWRREKLLELQYDFNHYLADVEGFVATNTPICPIHIGCANRAVDVANQLKERGFWLTAIRPPTVPSGTARLRVTLTAAHDKQQIRDLANQIHKII